MMSRDQIKSFEVLGNDDVRLGWQWREVDMCQRCLGINLQGLVVDQIGVEVRGRELFKFDFQGLVFVVG